MKFIDTIFGFNHFRIHWSTWLVRKEAAASSDGSEWCILNQDEDTDQFDRKSSVIDHEYLYLFIDFLLIHNHGVRSQMNTWLNMTDTISTLRRELEDVLNRPSDELEEKEPICL